MLPTHKTRRSHDDPQSESKNLKVKHLPQRQMCTLQRIMKKIEGQNSIYSTSCTVPSSQLKEESSISKALNNEYVQEYDDWRRQALEVMESEDE
jgi:hypothetical protein